MKRMKSLLVCLIVMTISYGSALAQNTVIVINFFGGTTTGTGCATRVNTVNVTLKDMSNNVIGTGTATGTQSYSGQYVGLSSYQIYSANPIPNGWQGKISMSGGITSPTCSPVSASIPESIITYNSGGCNDFSFSAGTSSVYHITLGGTIYAPIGDIAYSYDSQCGGTTANFSLVNAQHSGTTFNWQVSENSSVWQTFRASAGSSITATIDELHHASFTSSKYSPRYVRAVGTNCPSVRTTAPTTPPVEFRKPKPTFTVTPVAPQCHGQPNGGFNVNITSAADNWIIYIYDPSLPVAIREVPTSTASNSILTLPAGTYDVEVQYNSYGFCADRKSGFAITNPPLLTATLTPSVRNGFNVSCLNGSDGTVTANVSGGTGAGTYSFDWVDLPHAGNSIGGQPAGTYSVIITDANNCTITPTPSIALTAPSAAPSVTITESGGVSPTYRVSCTGVNDGQVTANPSSQVSGAFSYVWNSNASLNTQTLTGLGAATYTVVVNDANGCSATASATLNKRPDINFTINEVNPITCRNQPTGALEVDVLTIVNATTPYSYSWSPTNPIETTSSISGKGPGIYNATVTDAKGCSVTKSRELTNPAGYAVTINPFSNFNGSKISCNGEADGELRTEVRNLQTNAVTIASAYEWQRNNAAYPLGSMMSSIADLDEAVYKVIITYGADCKAEATYDLQDPDPIVPIITIPSINDHHGSHISCPGKSDGELHVVGTGGTKKALPDEYDFKWSATETGAVLIMKPAGIYSVTATDANGCTGTASMTLLDPAPINPVVNITSDYYGLPVKCHNSSDGELLATSAAGAAPIDYTWSTGTPGPTLSGVSPGTYTVHAKDANDCEMTSPQKVVINPEPVVASITVMSDFEGQAISCHNATTGRLRATGDGGTLSYTYLWNTTTTGMDLNDLGAGTYTVAVTDQNGCSDSESQTLVNPAPVIASISTKSNFNGFGVHCNGDADGFAEASAQGGTESFTYLWAETNETTARAEDLAAGTYTITVKDSNGCPATTQYEVKEPTTLTIGLTDYIDIRCFGGTDGAITVSAMGGIATDYNFSIDNTNWQQVPEFTGLRAAVPYTIAVKDANGCQAELTRTLAQPTQIKIDFTTEPAFCADPRGAATAEVQGGVGGYTYQWRDLTSSVISKSSSITAKPAGVYSLEVRDASDCPMIEDIGIVSTDGPQVIITEIVPAKCSYSSDGSAMLDVTAGDGPFTFLWPDGQTANTGLNLSQGRYLVSVKDANDCPTVAMVNVPAPEQLDIMLAESIVPSCKNSCDGSIQVESQGGTGPYTFAWAASSGPLVSGLCAGTHSVTVTDANSCVLAKSFVLTEPELLSVRLVERVLPLCKGVCNGEFTVEGSGGNGTYNYAWSSGGDTANPSLLCAGDHILTLTDNKGCALTRTFSLGEPELLRAQLTRSKAPICHDGCDGELAVSAIGGTGAYSYQWNNNATTNALTQLCVDDYEVMITDDNACTVKSTYTVTNPPALVVDLGGSVTLCTGQTHVLDAGTNWNVYAWGSNTGFTSSVRSVTIGDAGSYWVDVIDSDGCAARDTFLLQTSTNLLQANMFMASEAMVGDTVVIIDVSWPLPENIVWTYPDEMTKILDLGFAIYGQFNEPGEYNVTLRAMLGQCNDELNKKITILPAEEDVDGGRLGYEKFVKEFTLYPNPTDGDFDIRVELAEQCPITLSVWNTATSRNVMIVHDAGRAIYERHIDLRPMTSGTYVLRLDHAKGGTSIRFIVH